MSGPESVQESQQDSGRGGGVNPWNALSVCLVAGFMNLLDVSIVNVALPSLREGLHASGSDLQWISSGYALAFGLMLVPAGRLGDLRGRRPVFIAGLTVFTVASALCGLAPSALLLVVFRLVQGAGAGVMQPQVSGFIQELFTGERRARAFGWFGATIGLSTAVGPLAGGLLIGLFGSEHGWRSVFFVNVPVGLVTIVLALRLLPAPGPGRQNRGLDPVGVVLLGGAVLLLMLPLVQSRSWGPARWALVLPALALFAGFVAWEHRYRARGLDPMLDPGLLRTRSYLLGLLLGLVYFSGFTAIFFIFALFLQSGHGLSPLESGLAVTPFAVGSGVSSYLSGRLVQRLGRSLVAWGLVLVVAGLVAGCVVVRQVQGDDVALVLALALLVSGIGSGAVITPNVTLTLSEVPVERAGTAGGALQTVQRLGAAAGIAVVGAVFYAQLGGAKPDYTAAMFAGLGLCTVLSVLALVMAVADVWLDRR